MGLQEIIDEIKKDSQSEYDNIVTRARNEALLLKQDRMEELKGLYEGKREVLEAELKRLKMKLFAKADLDAERENQLEEGAIVDRLLKESYIELVTTLKEDKKTYSGFIADLINRALKLTQSKKISVSLCKEDEPLLKDLKKLVKGEVEQLESVKIDGGVICVAGQSYIDSSLECLFKQMRPVFLKLIIDEIKGKPQG